MPPPGGPGGPGGPLGPLGLLCWIPLLFCCFAPPPPPQQTVIVVDSNGNPVNRTPSTAPAYATATPVSTSTYREVKALEFREGDTPKKYYLDVPLDINYSQAIQVELGGSLFTVKVPNYIAPGEKIIVIAPAPVHGNA